MLKNNKFNLLLSIVLAIVLWAYITTVVNPDTQSAVNGIQVELVNTDILNDRGFTVASFNPTSIDITVSGSRSDIAKLKDSDFRATVDMAGYRKGINKVPINLTTPNNIEVVQLRPDQINVEVVDLVTVFKPVKLEFEDSFPSGMEPGFLEVSPEEMEVTGVASVVDSVDHIRALVKAGQMTDTRNSFRVDVDVIDKGGNVIYNTARLSQSSVEVSGMICKVKRVPLDIEMIGQPNESVEVTDMYIPPYVWIRGEAGAIDSITDVQGKPIDLSQITSTTEIPLSDVLGPGLPQGVEIADFSKNAAVRVEVQGIAKKEFNFTADMIDIANLQPTLSGHVNTGSVNVTVYATKDVLAQITQDDIHLSVDATDQRWAGNLIEMDVTAVSDIEVKDITVDPKKVRVTIVRE